MLKIEDAARLCHISRATCYRAVKRGEIPHVRIGKLIRIARPSLEAMLKGEKLQEVA
ncbi:MAG: helix-turn-helix domain-containing protein [Armatimonadota bacterium]|nr:helix-turn-helix domain-containing protein [bacterium]